MDTDFKDLRDALEDVYEEIKHEKAGTLPTYIPELSNANPDHFAIAVATVDGKVFSVGDDTQTFTIQSMVKPFLYGANLERLGSEAILEKIGVEPTGDAFNKIKLLPKCNRPYNPMVNSGAIVLADLLEGRNYHEKIVMVKKILEQFAGNSLGFDISVYTSEKAVGHHNRAMAYLMLNFGILEGNPEEILETYFQACSFLVNVQNLAIMGATLANAGLNPLTQEKVIRPQCVRDVTCLMMTCGMYDFAGEWAYTVGIPGKSGVSGGIIGVVPGRMGIGVFSPPLDDVGNSVRGIKVFQALSQRYPLSIF